MAIPKPTGTGKRGKITALPSGTTYRNLRAQPNASSADQGDAFVGDNVTYWSDRAQGEWVYVENHSRAQEGWLLASAGVTIVPDAVQPEPEIPPAPDPALFIPFSATEIQQLANLHTSIALIYQHALSRQT